jgi:hypothetical protein
MVRLSLNGKLFTLFADEDSSYMIVMESSNCILKFRKVHGRR